MKTNSGYDFKKEVMKLVESSKVVTTSEIAEELEVSWNTAEKHLLELTLDNKITRMKKAGVNLWVIK
jgi:Mn-dependent DtxR family transcriptional regulator